jgi:membrane-bound inhibitor of C-type lysozyme
LTASFRTAPAAPSVRLAIAGGRSVRLPQVLSADGGRYRLGAVEFWIKGQSATLTRKGTATVCNVS